MFPKKKGTVLLITSHFPFNGGETFLETEIEYLLKCYNQVIIVSRDIKSTSKREIPQSIQCFRYNPSSSFKDYLRLPFILFSNFRIITLSLKSELKCRKSKKDNLTIKKFGLILKAIIKALQLKIFLQKVISTIDPAGNIVLYSYWFNSAAHALAMMESNKFIRIARAHRGELYEEINENRILPLQSFACSNIDHVFFISNNGMQYLKSHLNLTQEKFSVSKLGVSYIRDIKPFSHQECFTIVSCSNLSPVKRVEIIIKAIAMIKATKPVRWFHFGNGALMNDLLLLAKEILSEKRNIEWHFQGSISNKEILDFYNNNNINLFINTSFSEGLPVSIMEAQIFGIPVIATDCGGTGEIVVPGTGTLLPVDSPVEDFSHAIEEYINMEENEYLAIRQRTSRNQLENYSAEKNYTVFNESIRQLMDQKNNYQND